jgi:hypothetical protein
MGCVAVLKAGKLTVDWSKNEFASDHSAMFQLSDICDVGYEYVDDDGNPVLESKEGMSAPLAKVAARLALLGYTIEQAKKTYCATNGYDHTPIPLSFEDVCDFMASVDLATATCTTPTTFFWNTLEGIGIGLYQHLPDGFTKAVCLENILNRLDGPSALVLFNQNPANAFAPVEWHYIDVVEGGYVKRDDVVYPLLPRNRFILLTEGSTDSAIMKKAIDWLRPDIADFFEFVETSDTSLTSSGELLKFARILAKVRVHSRILVIFDNDTTGCEAFEAVSVLALPSNVGVMCLPHSDRFASFATIGPTESASVDINGKAVAVECFLDLTFRSPGAPAVRWGAYNNKMKRYQGALERKDDFTKVFLALKSPEGYDFSGLKLLVDAVVAACEQVARASGVPFRQWSAS